MPYLDMFSARSLEDLCRETASRLQITPVVVEKDYWTCWVLDRLFLDHFVNEQIMFKGGTTLSKVFGLIERFSEDIDLILNWDLLKERMGPMEAQRSKTGQDKFNKRTIEVSREYLKKEFHDSVGKALGRTVQTEIPEDEPDVIEITYPRSFKDPYLRPGIRLEIGPLAGWNPNDEYYITPYVAEEFPDLFSNPRVKVRAISDERTFWEKATILHQEAHRPAEKKQPGRYSRHYYDLMRMAISVKRQTYLDRIDLLEEVVAFKKKHYPCTWASYDSAKPGTIKLIPSQVKIRGFESDYQQMKTMIFGETPEFDSILKILKDLEDSINTPSVRMKSSLSL
jgi:hypothetical protein